MTAWHYRESDVITVILGGGRGARLDPLTRERCKPAVPIAGKYRLIDVPISNSLHAGIDRIFVITQFNSASLNRHIAQTYRFSVFSLGFVNVLAADLTAEVMRAHGATAAVVALAGTVALGAVRSRSTCDWTCWYQARSAPKARSRTFGQVSWLKNRRG